MKARYEGQWLAPKISVDTRHASTAAKALENGAKIINDVSHFSDPEMLSVLRASDCQVVLMHSLAVPADPKLHLAENTRASLAIFRFMETELEKLDQAGIHSSRVILDPGIGFGLTSLQSLEVLNSLSLLQSFKCPVLIGHSRKSFFSDWSAVPASERDPETLGASLALTAKGVDILRVHDPVLHHRSLLAWSHVI